MVYEPLYHAREIATINCFLVALEKEIRKAYQYYLIVFNKTIIALALVGYEMIIANSVLRASLAIYHLIPNTHSWNNCSILLYVTVLYYELILIVLAPPLSFTSVHPPGPDNKEAVSWKICAFLTKKSLPQKILEYLAHI